MKKCFFLAVLCAYAVAGTAFSAWGAPARAPIPIEDVNPGYVFNGSASAGGWNYMLDAGRRATDAAFPGLRSAHVESVEMGGPAVAAMESLIRRHNSKLIFACAFGYWDFVQEMAQKHPDIAFMHVSGSRREDEDNVGTIFGRMYQPRYLSGMVAGSLSKSGKIGYVAAYPIPEVIRTINAFTLGARQVNPHATVKVMWLHSWYTPSREKEAAQVLIEAGCDLLGMDTDTGAVARESEDAGVYVIGYNHDMSGYAPTMHLTAPVWKWERFFGPIVQQVADGTWKPEDMWWGMKEGVVDLAPFGPAVPEDVRKIVNDEKERVISGEQLIFTGPIKDQTGTARIREGETMPDADIWGMDWFVEGVLGDIPRY
ncbi:MAG: BMP family ABC transporter substrate-binding protein [Synergistaceae bacterium]|nr:BMP family ABC transporter substrate-binding protein [Synergistaceae bacterium]